MLGLVAGAAGDEAFDASEDAGDPVETVVTGFVTMGTTATMGAVDTGDTSVIAMDDAPVLPETGDTWLDVAGMAPEVTVVPAGAVAVWPVGTAPVPTDGVSPTAFVVSVVVAAVVVGAVPIGPVVAPPLAAFATVSVDPGTVLADVDVAAGPPGAFVVSSAEVLVVGPGAIVVPGTFTVVFVDPGTELAEVDAAGLPGVFPVPSAEGLATEPVAVALPRFVAVVSVETEAVVTAAELANDLSLNVALLKNPPARSITALERLVLLALSFDPLPAGIFEEA